MNFTEYERNGQWLYASFAEAIAAILKSAIAGSPNLHLQEIQFRGKDTSSLFKKLQKSGKVDSPDIGSEIKDLSGCRLIFYTNMDVDNFASSGIIRENFSIDSERTKIHYPSSNNDDANALFISQNYVVQLDEKRNLLPEYSRFSGLKCEVQVQTILNHAWAQMAHDTIYKPPTAQGFGKTVVDNIGFRLAKVMRNYLLPAGYEFQKIMNDYHRLLSGKEMFDANALDIIRSSNNLNDLHDSVERFENYVLHHYDDIATVFPDIYDTLLDAIERALKMSEVSYQTTWGKYSGKDRETVIAEIFSILSHMRYIDVDRSFDAIIRLNGQVYNEKQIAILDKFAKDLSEHNLAVWKKMGVAVQSHLVARIEKLDEEEALSVSLLLTTMLAEVLQSTVEGVSQSGDSVVISRGSVVASDQLIASRQGAIALLKKLYRATQSKEVRNKIITALGCAGNTPNNSGYSNTLVKIIIDNLAEIVRFYCEVFSSNTLEERRKLEDQIFRHYYSYSSLPSSMKNDDELVAASAKLVAEIEAARHLLNSDPDFVTYKALVGFDSVSDRMWEECSYDYNADAKESEETVERLARSVTIDSIDDWVDRLNRYAETESNDLATFRNFGDFIGRVAEYQPNATETLLARMSDSLRRFLPAILHGFARAGQQSRVDCCIDRYIAVGQHLAELGWYLQAAKSFDESRLLQVFNRAVELQDDDAVLNCGLAAIHQYEAHPGVLIDRVFLPCIQYLSEKDDFRWLGVGFLIWRNQKILEGLDVVQSRQVLNTMLPVVDLERRGEEVVAGIAGLWPDLVLEFLGRRLAMADSGEAPESYRAIPFRLHRLSEPLSQSPDRIISAVRAWFNIDKKLFEFRGGRLVNAVFPEFNKNLDERLKVEISNRDRDSIDFVLDILRNYEGVEALYPLCADCVAALDPSDELVNSVGAVLYSSGVLVGEYGSVLALEAKRDALAEWLKDSRESVRNFASHFIFSLEQSIAEERRRADQQVAMRKPPSDE